MNLSCTNTRGIVFQLCFDDSQARTFAPSGVSVSTHVNGILLFWKQVLTLTQKGQQSAPIILFCSLISNIPIQLIVNTKKLQTIESHTDKKMKSNNAQIQQQQQQISTPPIKASQDHDHDQEEQQEQSQYRLDKWKKSSRKYSRITPDVKDRLIFLIVRNNMSIKQAATSLKINYSSAKFIFNQYRHKNQKCENLGIRNDLIIRKLEEGENDTVFLKCSVGGKFESQCTKTFSADEIYLLNAQKNEQGEAK